MEQIAEAVEKKKLRHELLREDFSWQRCLNGKPLSLACTPHLHNDRGQRHA